MRVTPSKNSPTVLWLNIASVIVLLLFNLSSMRVTLVGVERETHTVHELRHPQPAGAFPYLPGVGNLRRHPPVQPAVGEEQRGER